MVTLDHKTWRKRKNFKKINCLESARTLLVHLGEMTEYLVGSGDMEKLGAVAGGMALVRLTILVWLILC